MSESAVFDMDKSCLGYSFEIPEEKLAGIDSDTFEVTVAFKHPWDWRSVDVSLEENVVEAGIGLRQECMGGQNVSDRSHRRRAERPG